ncbi:MAG: hypothetical protein EA397_00720 [Deltaproteobacteria bacterium]|nr:MAG: hypothetical protein EA397_00720 [Deltaproteobacteria bacterium]
MRGPPLGLRTHLLIAHHGEPFGPLMTDARPRQREPQEGPALLLEALRLADPHRIDCTAM